MSQATATSNSRHLRPLVISIHGIRTRGEWQKKLTYQLNLAELDHLPLDYGFFSAIRLIWPRSRRRQIEWFRDQYTELAAIPRQQFPSVVAHSFGSYLVAKSIEMFGEIRFENVIFCGSIIRADYPWTDVITRSRVKRVLNEYGPRDFWASVVRWFVADAGNSGTIGFKDDGCGKVLQRAHNNLLHSGYFFVLNFKTWIDFLKGSEPEKPLAPKRHTNYRFLSFATSLLIASGLLLYKVSAPYAKTLRLSTIVERAIQQMDPSVTFMIRNSLGKNQLSEQVAIWIDDRFVGFLTVDTDNNISLLQTSVRREGLHSYYLLAKTKHMQQDKTMETLFRESRGTISITRDEEFALAPKSKAELQIVPSSRLTDPTTIIQEWRHQ